MTTTKSRATANGQAETKVDEPNPLLTNQPPPQENRTAAAPEPDWKTRAQQCDKEAKFWKKKYIEQMVNHAQVTAALAQPFLAQEAMEQFTSGNPEIAAKLAELQAQQ